MPKKLGRGMLAMPFGPPVKSEPVDQHQPDDLAEGEGDERQVVAAEPQHREAEDHPQAAASRPASGRQIQKIQPK